MDKIEVLHRTKLFEKLLPAEISTLAELCQPRTFAAGERILREGDPGDALYLLVRGSVEVLRQNPRGEERLLSTLSAPEFFGEMALIDKAHRSASVRARDEVEVLTLSAENLHTFARAYRDGFTWITVNIARVLSQRLRETNRRLAEKG